MKVPTYFSKEVADSLFTPLHTPEPAQSRYKDYNVVLFILESFSAENSAHLSADMYADGEQGYMPFLDSLMRNGVDSPQDVRQWHSFDLGNACDTGKYPF